MAYRRAHGASEVELHALVVAAHAPHHAADDTAWVVRRLVMLALSGDLARVGAHGVRERKWVLSKARLSVEHLGSGERAVVLIKIDGNAVAVRAQLRIVDLNESVQVVLGVEQGAGGQLDARRAPPWALAAGGRRRVVQRRWRVTSASVQWGGRSGGKFDSSVGSW